MDSIALLSDLHGNLPALEAVLADIRKRSIQRMICLGDLVGKGPQPVEVIELMRATCETILVGNWELGIAKPQQSAGGLWQQHRIGAERLKYLAQLPYSIDFHMSGKRVRLFHASPQSVYHRVLQNASLSQMHEMFEHSESTGGLPNEPSPDVIGYADIHTPYMTPLDNPWTVADKKLEYRGRLLFNTGSVGLPYDGVPQASYVILQGRFGSLDTDPFSIQFVRVPYDVELAVRLAEQSGMPERDTYITEIRTGFMHSKLP